MYFFIKILYTMAPNKKIRSKSVGYGAIFTTFSWVVITNIYSYYINNIAHYSTFYGGLANIVILMFWFYLLAYAFTIGMSLNYRKEEVELENMNSYERRIIHNILSDNKYVYTESVGEEPERHVVIKPKENK